MSEFLKCDAPDCDHHEDVLRVTADMVGKACPKCGESLLTQEDWDVYSSLSAGLDALEALGIQVRADADTPQEQRAAFNYHDGEIRISIPALTTHKR